MKKFLLCGVVLCAFMVIPFDVSAKSIQDYRNEITKLEKEKAEREASSAAIDKKIDETNEKINEITRQIVQARKDQESTQKEINALDVKIDQKEEEIKDLVAFYQISDNDNFYLKFIFGADSFEDFIYRFSVAEQLTDANDKLVDEMNGLISDNKKKIKELNAEEKKLDNLNVQMQKEISNLGDQKRDVMEDVLSVDEEIAIIEKQIKFFKSQGCNDTQDVNSCSNNAPSANGFIVPTPTGVIMNDGMSEYGYRWHPIWGDYRFHSGMDISAGYGVTVMASATGKVIHVGSLWGFGTAVMIVHNVGGKQYTSLYAHLNSYCVSVGSIVERGQKIGEVGSTGDSTGPHLHFQMMSGSGYSSSGTVNPRNFVNFPNTGVYW